MDSGCLRPEFTHHLLASLLQGKSLNMISPHGQGRRRTLQDLRSMLPKSWRIFQVNMRDVGKDGSLLDTLLQQTKIENIGSIHDFISRISKTSIYHLIIIHNFEFLTDLNVISCLNDIEKHAYVSLLCVSEEKQEKSGLSATDYMLPSVTSKQLQVEIRRRNLPVKQDDVPLLADFLLHQTSPYSLLDTKPVIWFSHALWKSEIKQRIA